MRKSECGMRNSEFGISHRGDGVRSRLPLLVRGAVTPKGFIGVTERILVRITVALRSALLGSPMQGELAFRLVLQAEKTEGLYRRPVTAFTPNKICTYLIESETKAKA